MHQNKESVLLYLMMYIILRKNVEEKNRKWYITFFFLLFLAVNISINFALYGLKLRIIVPYSDVEGTVVQISDLGPKPIFH